MAYSFFPMIARMRYINRWGLMRNTQTENIQEHSHMVAVLAHALAVIENEKFGGQVDPGQVAVAALYHDASEILTGDMPTPTYEDAITIPDPEVKALVKAADKLDAYLKCVEELKAGNAEFRKAKEQTYAALCQNPIPALRYFMEHFLADFSLTLDELN